MKKKPPSWRRHRTSVIGWCSLGLFIVSFLLSQAYLERYTPWRKAAYETSLPLENAQQILEKTIRFEKEIPTDPEAFQDNLLHRANLYQKAYRRPLPLVNPMQTVDGWGHPFQYRTTPSNSPGYEVFSVGEDGRAGTRDDLPSTFNPAVTPPHLIWWEKTAIVLSAMSIFAAGVWVYLLLAPLPAITAFKYCLILFAGCFLWQLLFPPLGGVVHHTLWNWLMLHLYIGSIVCILGMLVGRPIQVLILRSKVA